jgi:hypothetical protein
LWSQLIKFCSSVGADVDLNLSISQPSSQSPKRDKNSHGLQLHRGSFDDSELKRAKASANAYIKSFAKSAKKILVQFKWQLDAVLRFTVTMTAT